MTKRNKYLIGTGAVLTLALVGGLGFATVDPTGPQAHSGFCARMPDAIGLYPGNPITQMGLQVGHVDRIEPEGDHVRVSFTLDGGRRFPVDVRAVTRSKSILADRSVELVGNYRTGPELAAGQCVPQEHSFTPKSISEIAGSAADFIDALSPNDNRESFEKAISGFDQALRGQGGNARTMMMHAAAAASSPDRLTADIGSIIQNMAPLTDEALQRWPAIRSIMDQLPAVVGAGIDLFPGVVDVCVGVGWLVNVLHDVQTNYGGLLWPQLQGPVADAIHLAASHSKDIAGLLDSIPSIAATLRQQAANNGGMSIDYRPPTVRVDSPAAPALCAAANHSQPGSCSLADGHVQVPVAGLLGLVLAKGQR